MRLLFSIAVFLIAWHGLHYFDSVIPSPVDVLLLMCSTEIFEILLRLFVTVKIVTIALLISIPLGYAAGIFCAFSGSLNGFLYPFFNGIKSVPVTVFIPLFLTVFHLDYFVIPMICAPLIATLSVNIANASKSVNGTRENISQSLRIKGAAYFRHILFWETLETLLATLRVILTYGLTLEIALDYFMRCNNGIGGYISSYHDGFFENKYVYMYAGIVAASIAGISLIKLLDILSKRALQWKIQMH